MTKKIMMILCLAVLAMFLVSCAPGQAVRMKKPPKDTAKQEIGEPDWDETVRLTKEEKEVLGISTSPGATIPQSNAELISCQTELVQKNAEIAMLKSQLPSLPADSGDIALGDCGLWNLIKELLKGGKTSFVPPPGAVPSETFTVQCYGQDCSVSQVAPAGLPCYTRTESKDGITVELTVCAPPTVTGSDGSTQNIRTLTDDEYNRFVAEIISLMNPWD